MFNSISVLLESLINYKKLIKVLKKINTILVLLVFSLVLLSCKSTKEKTEEDSVFKKKRINPSVEQRARESADKGGGIFNSSRGLGSTTYEFATSNVLWRATLSTIDFMPLSEADYSGGIVSTDWYSPNVGSKESIKLTIRFLSTEVSPASIKVISHKKICSADNQCSITKISNTFDQEIKDKIFTEVKKITLEDEKKKKSKK